MKNLLLLSSSLIVILACNLGVSATPVIEVTPTASAIPTLTPEPSPSAPSNGTITGKLSYPSEFIPPLRVVAFSLTDGTAYFIDTAQNQMEYSMDVPAGTYNVVAYPHEGAVPGTTGQVDSYIPNGGPFAGGYTQMVPCGLAAGCDDHTLLPVTVNGGETVSADPGDWYAPEGTFPPMPSP
jgi:hypothetical protein